MRRHELEERAGRGGTGSLDARSGMDGPPAGGGPEAAAPLSQLLLDDVRALALKLDDMRRERADPSALIVSASRPQSRARRAIDSRSARSRATASESIAFGASDKA
jgi:hypothetical protein